ncbi:MAG: HAMP domain-containing sensor histidine kinase [bacterium]
MKPKFTLNRFWIVLITIAITALSLWFTNQISETIAKEENRKMRIWAEATSQLLNDDYSDIVFRIIEENENIPVIIVDNQYRYISARNFNEPKKHIEAYYREEIQRLRVEKFPIKIELGDGDVQYIYFDDSLLLKQLDYFPYIQIALIILLILVIFWTFSTDKRAEENLVWVGLSKETAHQLGTPITSLLAWIEILKTRYSNDSVIQEMGKDVERLQTIAERFSKIGSKPELTKANISTITENAVSYMQKRSSKKIKYSFDNISTKREGFISTPLYEWVIENLCKNAIDAMAGKGSLDFELFNEENLLIIEATDSGKGIERSKFKTVFKPGFTTKKRGWGLGLSLAKRIIEEYHGGKIFVKSSDLGVGTTFRIEMPIIAEETNKIVDETVEERELTA